MSPLPYDPVWHVSSRRGVATLRTAIHLLLTYLLIRRAHSSKPIAAGLCRVRMTGQTDRRTDRHRTVS